MSEFVEDQFWREEVVRARMQTPERKLALGGELFDAACEVTISGITFQHPGIGRAEVLAELRKRLALSRRMEGRV